MARITRWLGAGAILLLMFVVFGSGWLLGTAGIGSRIDPAALPELERQFAERMRGAALVGFFTVSGREDRPARPDRYDIASVEKIGDERWQFNARMSYGGNSLTLPFPVTMRWVGDTPMIQLTDVSIPSMGTFTVRLFFYRDRYAGTWQNERGTGGHMFGRVEKQSRP